MHIATFTKSDIFDYKLIKYFLQLGANPDSKSNKGYQVLEYAKSKDVGKSIIQQDLLGATMRGDVNKFKILSSLGCDPDKKQSIFLTAPIHKVRSCFDLEGRQMGV